ncbi:MAG: class I SAM-dependent methyltransferase [Chloroflexota bacterium]
MSNNTDSWTSGDFYDSFMGRWSKLIGINFLEWLAVPPSAYWLDVGCGTGALTQEILHSCQPQLVTGIDLSEEFVAYAKNLNSDPRAEFSVGSAEEIDLESNSIDAVVSGLVLNFVPQPAIVIAEMLRVTKPGGMIGIFLWDYAEGMEMLRYFWDAAVALDAGAKELDEGIRFPLCREGALETLVRSFRVGQVEAAPIEAVTVFKDFDDYWMPFLQPVGPAPGYLASRTPEDRKKLEDFLWQTLPISKNGSISLNARAWAVKIVKPS